MALRDVMRLASSRVGATRSEPLAAEAEVAMAQFALAWFLPEPNVASAIIGVSRPKQIDDNAVASGLAIDLALFAKAKEIVAVISARPIGRISPDLSGMLQHPGCNSTR